MDSLAENLLYLLVHIKSDVNIFAVKIQEAVAMQKLHTFLQQKKNDRVFVKNAFENVRSY